MLRATSSKPGGVDRDAARVLLDRAEQRRAQPRNMSEQSLVRGLTQRHIKPDVVGGDAEPGAVCGDVARHQRRALLRTQREADVGRAEHLGRQPAEPLTDLRTEHRPRQLLHHAEQRPGHAHPALRLRRHDRGRGLDHSARDRIDQGLPRGPGLLHPLRAAPGQRTNRAGGEGRDRVEPGLGQPHRLVDRAAFGVGNRRVTVTHDLLPREVAGEIPVDRSAGVLQEPAHLLQGGPEVGRGRRPEQGREGILRNVAGLVRLVAAGPEPEGLVTHVGTFRQDDGLAGLRADLNPLLHSNERGVCMDTDGGGVRSRRRRSPVSPAASNAVATVAVTGAASPVGAAIVTGPQRCVRTSGSPQWTRSAATSMPTG